MTAATQSDATRREARRFPVGSPDWAYRIRAAWKLHQIAQGIPVDEWTDEAPAWFAQTQEGVSA